MKNSTILSKFKYYSPVVKVIILLGLIFRLTAWFVYSPSWKTHAHLYPMYIGNLKYIGDFISYTPGRLPFFNLFSFVFYRLTEPLLGTRSLSLAALFISIVSLPFLYEAIRGLFNRRTAVFSLILYSLYPKLIILGAWGMAEVATVGFVVFTLFAIERATHTERIGWYFLTGVFALLANLTYLSTVVFVVILSVALYFRSFNWPPSLSVRELVPDRQWWAYSSLPGIFGLIYVRYGLMSSYFQGDFYSAPLFIREYTLLGSAARYIAYTFFDFWWHTRGFDNASGIIKRLGNVQDLFGPLFPIYLIGWLLITVTVTGFIIFGLVRLTRQRGVIPRFVVVWVAVYVLIKLIENAGWMGTFQTRHLIAVFPAFVVAFGVGVSGLLDRLESQRHHSDFLLFDVIETAVPDDNHLRSILTLFIIVGLVGLCVNATANGILRPDNKVESATAAAIESQVDKKDVVAATDYTGYAEIMVYTHGEVVPRVIIEPGGSVTYDRPGPIQGVVPTTPEGLSNTSIDYIAVHTTCHEFTQEEQSYLNGAERVGEITYNKTFSTPGSCTSYSKIVKID